MVLLVATNGLWIYFSYGFVIMNVISEKYDNDLKYRIVTLENINDKMISHSSDTNVETIYSSMKADYQGYKNTTYFNLNKVISYEVNDMKGIDVKVTCD